MNYVVLDLEFNSTYSEAHHRFINEIIEIGAVKCDEKFNIINTFSVLIKPAVSKELNIHVSKLTNISIKELNRSNVNFKSAIKSFVEFMDDSILMTWSTTDILVLRENCTLLNDMKDIDFAEYYLNLQRYCELALDYHDKSRQMGLSTCAQRLNIKFDETILHRALSDAKLSMLCLKELFEEPLFSKNIEEVGKEFFRKITYKNTNICDLKDPLVDKKQMFILCDICGKKAKRKSKWRLKNKSFRAGFRCSKCHRNFEGRIIIKKCYDGVKIIKKTFEPLKTDNSKEKKYSK